MPEPKVYGVGDVAEADVETLRTRFMERVQQDDLKDSVDPVDVRRIRADPLWLKRFIAHGDLDLNSSLNFMVETFKFRHQMKANSLTMRDVDKALLEKGAMCSHGEDKTGTRIVIFNARFHERGHMEECKTYLVYWLEKMEREERGERITMFFDMANAGLSNVDIPFISYLINLFKLYYPDMLNAIIVFELPWIMNAAWKIVKNLLPPKSHQLIKFTSKKDVGDFVKPEYRLTRWGGTDEWEYKFDPKECSMPPSPFLGKLVNGEAIQEASVADGHIENENMSNGHVPVSRKSSHSDSQRSSRSRERTPAHQTVAKYHSIREEDETAHGAKVHFSEENNTSFPEDLTEGHISETSETTTDLDGLLEITPGEEVWFGSGSQGGRRTIELVNIRSGPVAYKMKTTSPEKFRVRPSTGVVGTGKRLSITLELCDGVSPQHVITDRFLLVAAPVPHERVPQKDMGTLWRSLSPSDKHEHRLRCATAPATEPLAALVRTIASRLDAVGAKVDQQQRRAEAAEEGQRTARKRLTGALVVMAVMMMLNLYLSYGAGRCL